MSMQLDTLTCLITSKINGNSIKILELQVAPWHDMMLVVYFEQNTPMGFALFEILEEGNAGKIISKQDLFISNHGHYDVHPNCMFAFETLCNYTVEKKLDLDIFMTALAFDHPLAKDAPLAITVHSHPNPKPSEEEYWNTLACIQIH